MIENDRIKVTLEELGAVVLSIVDKNDGSEHFWQWDPAIWPRRTAVCFPVCGVLIDSEYVYKGKTYSLPMHGFLRETRGALTVVSADHAYLSFSDTEETRANYPFAFSVIIDYKLEGSSLIITYQVRNTGCSVMPYSIGAHYTYALPSKLPDCEYLFSSSPNAGSYTQDGCITGVSDVSLFKGNTLPMDHLFDVSGKIYKVSDLDTDYIAIGRNGNAFTKVEFSGFRNVVLWGKGNSSPFACIEPWDGIGDWFDHDKDIMHKRDINLLEPGAERVYTQKVSFGYDD
ncbi:MAG: hypothetical protein IJ863_09225 [Spirochaetales bacterium]|nr:hypothetical protein [Spirochaetales bacterium]